MSRRQTMVSSVIAMSSLVMQCTSAHGQEYVNGPIITDPNAGFGGADASALQSLLGLQTLAFANQLDVGNRLADDFAVPQCKQWKITEFVFPGFQTGSGTNQSTFTSVNIQVWKGAPGLPGSFVVWGDTTTNRLTSSTFSNIYRVTDLTLTNNQRPLFNNICTVTDGPVLAGGTSYWVDWQMDGTIFSGPFVPTISIKGQTQKPGANARQFLSFENAWNNALDNGPGKFAQDLAFSLKFEEQELQCYADCDLDCQLNVADFICYQTYFALGDLYADCDGSGALGIDDFICFQTVFSLGC
jgi:hypothetical protein